MGAGKSKIGNLLALKMGVGFYDLDIEIEKKAKKDISEIFSSIGETGFRDLETDVLKEVSAKPETRVIATGGGVVLKDENWNIMNQCGVTVYLDVDLDTIWARIKDSNSRPLLKVYSPYDAVKKLFRERKDKYQRADYIFKTDSTDPNERTKELIELIN